METSYFWDGNRNAGDVGDCGPYAASALAGLLAVVAEERTGVTSGLVVTASTPAARSVTVSAGKLIIAGQLYTSTTPLTMALDENTSGNPRIDSIAVEADWTAQTMRLKVIKGTPAASPAAPALTQIVGSLWQERLANIQIANGYTTVADGDITRSRRWARPDFPGQITMTAVAPPGANGWVICNGQALSRTAYVDLFDAIGTSFGVGDGSTTFNVPDFRGRSPLGMDNLGGTSANRVTNANADVIGGAGGTETHTLSEAEMPAHGHQEQGSGTSGTGTTPVTYGSVAGSGLGNFTLVAQNVAVSSGGYLSPLKTANAGGGGAHNNMHPWLAVPVYIRT
ncbi:MAG TPA: tail fiber protein [Aggregatilinea sp.]|uniref:phage tail protein n=1 Tax=Aggregatilinea sp. TaxID=2806333 RepID=UPI002CF97087|nr:tail fiber protein [Aggregatilinea sp.]HML21878.1 tail fiber protein [Aggregatilinea sp.]